MKPKEAFEILRDTPIDIRSAREDDIHSLYATAQNMALDALQRQMGIPCSEMLPEDDRTKLVTLSNGLGEGGYYSDDAWWCIGDYINLEKLTDEVIAWMPLPEPYKEGGSE